MESKCRGCSGNKRGDRPYFFLTPKNCFTFPIALSHSIWPWVGKPHGTCEYVLSSTASPSAGPGSGQFRYITFVTFQGSENRKSRRNSAIYNTMDHEITIIPPHLKWYLWYSSVWMRVFVHLLCLYVRLCSCKWSDMIYYILFQLFTHCWWCPSSGKCGQTQTTNKVKKRGQG